MAKWGMVFDLKACIGCNACVVACKQENSLPNGVFFTRTLSYEQGKYPNVKRTYVPTICNQCEAPPCQKVCPSGATYTREDGIVMVDRDLCIGCSSCAVACPYDMRTMLSEAMFTQGLFGTGEITPFEQQGYARYTPGTAVKCDFCSQRVDQGLKPACVQTCPANARVFGDLDDPQSAPNVLLRERKGKPPLPEKNTKPRVYYVG
ncbi:MAG: 4Fe-4S dicluster domain-containing protein [Burkholderiaceae bacterium]|jgi:molybdopterin-containing oxidoreductase family iron-sulfur binding subunit|nr:4Fe-4S dicluster domain-containing protein [Burkholderiaceae bacterium]